MNPALISSRQPFIVAVGGTLRMGSSTEQALRRVLGAVAAAGAETLLFSGPELDLPMYAPGANERAPAASRLVDALRRADAIVLGSPGYHGGVSGLVKNALDYTEDLRDDPRPYFAERPVACVATGAGWQGAVNTLSALRDIVHALRGWNTPLGVALNTTQCRFDARGACSDAHVDGLLQAQGLELLNFLRCRPAALAA